MNQSVFVLILALLCIGQVQSMSAAELNYYFSRSNDIALVQTNSLFAINMNLYNGMNTDLVFGRNQVLEYVSPWSPTASKVCRGCKISNKYVSQQELSSIDHLNTDWTSFRAEYGVWISGINRLVKKYSGVRNGVAYAGICVTDDPRLPLPEGDTPPNCLVVSSPSALKFNSSFQTALATLLGPDSLKVTAEIHFAQLYTSDGIILDANFVIN